MTKYHSAIQQFVIFVTGFQKFKQLIIQNIDL